jgi:multicomponent Na+:H+ antiporter subunit C
MLLMNLNYSFAIILFCIGLYVVFASADLIKKLFGLSLFQTSILWFYLSIAKLQNAQPPILNGIKLYSNPLPQVLMLTAIVVGITTLAFGFSLAIIINKNEEEL